MPQLFVASRYKTQTVPNYTATVHDFAEPSRGRTMRDFAAALHNRIGHYLCVTALRDSPPLLCVI